MNCLTKRVAKRMKKWIKAGIIMNAKRLKHRTSAHPWVSNAIEPLFSSSGCCWLSSDLFTSFFLLIVLYYLVDVISKTPIMTSFCLFCYKFQYGWRIPALAHKNKSIYSTENSSWKSQPYNGGRPAFLAYVFCTISIFYPLSIQSVKFNTKNLIKN